MKRTVFGGSMIAAAVFAAAWLGSGCSSTGPDNNYLHVTDFVRHLEKDGIEVKSINPLSPMPLAAGEALEIAIGNSNIGVYKYDITNSAQRHRLEVIRKSKRIYFNGIPYPIYEVSGSFIVVGLDKHKDKKRILESLRHFK